jgi:hypothetical protein
MIVVRPHPSECHDAWLSLDTPKNVLVSSEFDIASWLSCSEAMIHNGCTTSVEATAMDVSVISYVPETSNEYDLVHANELGEVATTLEVVIKILRSNKEQAYTGNKLVKLNEIIKYQPNSDASKDIAEHLYAGAKLLSDGEVSSRNSAPISFLVKESIKLVLSLSKIRPCYARKKFPFISTSKFNENVENVSECFGLGAYEVQRLGIDVFRITKNQG